MSDLSSESIINRSDRNISDVSSESIVYRSDRNITDLPMDLAEEILCRLPVTSLRRARSTCKKWNTLARGRGFAKKHMARKKKKKEELEFEMVMMVEHRVSLMSVNLLTPSIHPIGKLTSLNDDVRIEISKIFHLDGLLLCVTKSRSLVVWNPFLGQTRWIEPTTSYLVNDNYALGYDKLRHSYKVLRFVNEDDPIAKRSVFEFEIYDIECGSWKVLDVAPDWDVSYFHHGLSIEGNTYWYAQEKIPLDGPAEVSDQIDFLLCFNFTTERFGPRLPLPFHSFYGGALTLSSVGEKQLAVLVHEEYFLGYPLKIWISTRIEPNAVSWSKFLDVNMKPLSGFKFNWNAGSFFVDQEKEVAVVFDKDAHGRTNMAHIIGKNGYFKQVDIGESIDRTCYPLVCSYVPSSVQITQPAPTRQPQQDTLIS